MTLALCTGDWQIGAHGRRDDQEAVFHRIVDLACERGVDVFLHGGDVFHGPTVYPEDLASFRRPLARLREAGIPVVVACGNGSHDQAMRSETALAVFDEYDGVSVFSRPGVFEMDGLVVAVLPWVSPARLVASRGGGSREEINAEAALLLVDVARGLHDDCRQVAADLPAVLLTHFAISGASLPTGLPVSMLSEPVLPLAELEALGFDAVVASHIHKPQLLASRPDDPEIPIFFTGSPMPHDHGEEGYEHGVYILELDAVRNTSVPEFVPVVSRPLVTLEWDHDEDPDVFAEILNGDFSMSDRVPGAIIRVRYTATADSARVLDTAALRRALLDAGAHSVVIQPDIVRADRARVAGVDESLSELAALDLWISEQGIAAGLADRMRDKTREYLEAVA